jgi:hypothetical protein
MGEQMPIRGSDDRSPPRITLVQGVTDLVRLLDDIERHRRLLEQDGRDLETLMQSYPTARRLWQGFLQCGGATREDFRLFLQGKLCGRVSGHGRGGQGLRLVVA